MQASPPLPLDLHVLSLSLAFILSQDQTLRCFLSCFFLFLYQKGSPKTANLSLSAVCPSASASARAAPDGFLAGLRLLCLVEIDRETFSCLLYYFVSIVSLSMFSSAPGSRTRKRMQSYGEFLNLPNFSGTFLKVFFGAPCRSAGHALRRLPPHRKNGMSCCPPRLCAGRLRGTCPEKRVQRYGVFSLRQYQGCDLTLI